VAGNGEGPPAPGPRPAFIYSVPINRHMLVMRV
jgi:hypothetical protein